MGRQVGGTSELQGGGDKAKAGHVCSHSLGVNWVVHDHK